MKNPFREPVMAAALLLAAASLTAQPALADAAPGKKAPRGHCGGKKHRQSIPKFIKGLDCVNHGPGLSAGLMHSVHFVS